jgi:hypothetical protein
MSTRHEGAQPKGWLHLAASLRKTSALSIKNGVVLQAAHPPCAGLSTSDLEAGGSLPRSRLQVLRCLRTVNMRWFVGNSQIHKYWGTAFFADQIRTPTFRF